VVINELLRNSLDLLTPGEKWRLVGLLMAILVVGLLQMAGVGSIVPLLGLLTNPESSETRDIAEFVRSIYDFSSSDAIIIFLASVAFGIIVIANALTAVTYWFMFRFVWSIQSRLSTEILARYLAHPYEILLGKNPAEAEKNILVEVHVFTNGVVLPLLRVIASGAVVVLVAGFLIVFNPILAAIATGVLGIGYMVSFFLVRQKLMLAGERRVDANKDRFRAVNEAIGGVKEIQVLGRTQEFVDRYQVPANRYARTTSLQQILADMPRYAIEVLAFGSVMLAALYVAVSSGNLQTVAPVIGVYVVAGYRLMPAMQKVYNAWSQIRFNKAVVGDLYQTHQVGAVTLNAEGNNQTRATHFKTAVTLSDLEYHYPESSDLVVDGLNMEIRRGQTISLIGETGSGKTTIAELLIGILRPSSGSILIDGVELDDQNIRNWQNLIGYVPQEIFLIDDTISANIAFGVPKYEIDFEAVRKAAKIANIDDFVMDETSDRYDTVIGDRGVRLSGGQRQRIGIARALYHQPSVLFLDEATSNLDQDTEFKLHEALEESLEEITVVIVAHRLNTTRSSDIIYVIDDGRILGSGTYEEIVNPDGTLRAKYSRLRNLPAN
jgi:ATP-binding cassette, subfamily B, bacterial PglK